MWTTGQNLVCPHRRLSGAWPLAGWAHDIRLSTCRARRHDDGGDHQQAAPAERSRPGNGPKGPTRLKLSKPVIAAISGHAVAGGLELALWADLRVAEETAILGVFCRRWGVPLIDGGTVRLPRLIGESRAMDLILTGRAVSAREAYEIGLVNRIVPPGESLAAARQLAAELAQFPQTCLRRDRASLTEQHGMDLDAAMANEFRHGQVSMAADAG